MIPSIVTTAPRGIQAPGPKDVAESPSPPPRDRSDSLFALALSPSGRGRLLLARKSDSVEEVTKRFRRRVFPGPSCVSV